MDELPFFAYGPFTESDTQIRVLGRRLEGGAATLPGFRVQESRGYTFLAEEEGSEVPGMLYCEMRRPDYWMLDDYQGLEFGLYKRRRVEVCAGDERQEAYVYVAGPAMVERQ